jgi:sucrose-phosphate synthase
MDEPDWAGFSNASDYYPGYGENPRIIRLDCGGTQFLNKERLWPHLDEFVGNLRDFYANDLPDAVTAHYADAGYCAALLKQQAGINFTFTGHSLGAQKLDKMGMTADNADELEQQYCFSRRIAAERMAMTFASRIITSTQQERFEQYSHPLYQGAVEAEDDSRFAVIPPGVNTRIFNTEHGKEDASIRKMITEKLGDANEAFIIASSRLDEKKNIIGLVRAYASSKTLQQQARLCLFVRGIDDPFSDTSALSSAERKVLQPVLETISGAGIRDRVDFLDLRSQLALAAAYRYFAGRGSVFALTAFYEPFGLASIEAAACGLAVVATRNGGPVEIFEDGSGVLVDPFDEDDIAKGLLDCLARQEALSKQSRERVRTTYTWESTAANYLDVIKKIVASGKSGTGVSLPALDDRDRIMAYLSPE